MAEEVAEELNRQANLQGKTLYSLVNEIAMNAIEAQKNGFSLSSAIEAKKIIEHAKRTRLLFVNQDLWYLASSKAYRSAKNEWLEGVYENARWYAQVFIGSGEGDALRGIKTLMRDFFWDCTSVSVDQVTGDEVRVRLVYVPEMPEEHTLVVFKGVEGICNVLRYVIVEYEVRPGFISLSLRRIPRVSGESTNLPAKGRSQGIAPHGLGHR